MKSKSTYINKAWWGSTQPPKRINPFSSSALLLALATTFLPNSQLAPAASWTPTAAGTYDWNNSNNWNSSFPNAVGAGATFNTLLTGNQTINLNQVITLASLDLADGNSSFSYNIAPNGGSFIFQNSSGSGAFITQDSTTVGHTVSAPITDANSQGLNVTNNSSALFTISGSITGSLTSNLYLQANSTGNIALSSVNPMGSITNYSTGTGTVIISGTIGANVTGVFQQSSTSILEIDGSAPTVNFTVPIGTLSSTSNTTPFGGGSGTISLGQNSPSNTLSATLLYTGNGIVANPISVNANTTGTLTIEGQANSNTFTGAVTLANNLTVDNLTAGMTTTFSTGQWTETSHNVLFLTKGTGAGSVAISSNIAVSGSFFITNNGTTNFTLSGNITGSTAVIKLNANSTGGITISGTSLNVGAIANSSNGSGVVTISALIGTDLSSVGQISSQSPLYLTNTANTYTGDTQIDFGILNATTFANDGTASSIGTGDGAARGLIIGGSGGTLQHTAPNVATTNRLFTIGDSFGLTAAIDSSAAAAADSLSFTNTAALAFGGTGARTLTLTGSNTGNNTFAPQINDGTGGNTSLVKSGNGTWLITNNNAYTGGTTLSAGTLVINNIIGSATGAASVTLNGGTLAGHGFISGPILAGNAFHTIAPSATLAPTSTGTLTLTKLTTNNNTALAFNLVSPGTNDALNITTLNGLTISGGQIQVANAPNTAASLGFYKIIQYNGTIQGLGMSSITAPATANNFAYYLDTTHDPGFIDLHRGYLGDTDDSGFVGINDLAILASNWQQPGGWAQGNFLNDPTVDINDLAILAANWQTGITSFGEAADSLGSTSESFQQAVAGIVFGNSSPVPEPTTLPLLALAALPLLRRRRPHPTSP